MATIQQAITLARYLLNDTVTTYGYSDTTLLQYGNDAIDAISVARPELFKSYIEITCIADRAEQTINVTDSSGLDSVIRVKGGNSVTMIDRDILDRFKPDWHTMASAAAEHWIPIKSDPMRFLIYPPAPSGQILVGVHVVKPKEYTISETHPLSDVYTSAIADYIVSMAAGSENERADNALSSKHLGYFQAKIGISKQTNVGA